MRKLTTTKFALLTSTLFAISNSAYASQPFVSFDAFVQPFIQASENPQPKEVVISKRVVKLPVEISATRVKLSQADYSVPVVKVLVPELAAVTLLDHRNTGEGAPCLATSQTRQPHDVIQNHPRIEEVEMTIYLVKNLSPNVVENSCDVSLTEHIDTVIRGFHFSHDRYLSVGVRQLADCQ